MAARLGNVLYWLACVGAVLALVLAVVVAVNPGANAQLWIGVYTAAAVVIWLVGRAVRYVLAGT